MARFINASSLTQSIDGSPPKCRDEGYRYYRPADLGKDGRYLQAAFPDRTRGSVVDVRGLAVVAMNRRYKAAFFSFLATILVMKSYFHQSGFPPLTRFVAAAPAGQLGLRSTQCHS